MTVRSEVDKVYDLLRHGYLPPLNLEQQAQVKNMVCDFVIASLKNNEPVDRVEIARAMHSVALLAKNDPEQLNVLAGMNGSHTMSLKDAGQVSTSLAKMEPDHLQKLKLAYKNPDDLTAKEKVELKNELKNAFKKIIDKLDDKHQLSEEQKNDLAEKFAVKFMNPKPGMGFKDLLKELDEEIKVLTKAAPKNDTELKHMVKEELGSAITASQAGKFAGLYDMALVNSKVTLPDPYNDENADSVVKIAEALEANAPDDANVDDICEKAGIHRHHEAMQNKPRGY